MEKLSSYIFKKKETLKIYLFLPFCAGPNFGNSRQVAATNFFFCFDQKFEPKKAKNSKAQGRLRLNNWLLKLFQIIPSFSKVFERFL